jgi:hypothetical protein
VIGHPVGPCKKCGHDVRLHSVRSGLCGGADCRCEGFVGPHGAEWPGNYVDADGDYVDINDEATV